MKKEASRQSDSVMFEGMTSIRAVLDNLKEELTGEISIGVYSHIGSIILPECIKKFTNKYPNVKMFVFNSRSGEIKEMLKNGKLDMIILHYPIFTDNDKEKKIKERIKKGNHIKFL